MQGDETAQKNPATNNGGSMGNGRCNTWKAASSREWEARKGTQTASQRQVRRCLGEKGVTRGTATGPGRGLFCLRRSVEQVDRFSFAGARLAGWVSLHVDESGVNCWDSGANFTMEIERLTLSNRVDADPLSDVFRFQDFLDDSRKGILNVSFSRVRIWNTRILLACRFQQELGHVRSALLQLRTLQCTSGSILEHFKRRAHQQSAAKLASIQFWEIRQRYWMQFLSSFSQHGWSLDSHSECTPGPIDSLLASQKISHQIYNISRILSWRHEISKFWSQDDSFRIGDAEGE
jgi:hypothetical protein